MKVAVSYSTKKIREVVLTNGSNDVIYNHNKRPYVFLEHYAEMKRTNDRNL